VASTQLLVHKYLSSNSQTEVNLSSEIRERIELLVKEGDIGSLKHILEVAQTEIVVILALGVFPRFLSSRFYEEWRNEENDVEDVKISFRISVLDEVSLKFAERRMALLDRALQSFDRSELKSRSYRNQSQWLSLLLTAVEFVPVMISLATASKSRFGFPLIYVNAAFEKATGYLRKEIVGGSCRFLQRGRADPEACSRIAQALRDAKPIKIMVKSFRKDGTEFFNLLALKPIFDEMGERPRYVFNNFDKTQIK